MHVVLQAHRIHELWWHRDLGALPQKRPSTWTKPSGNMTPDVAQIIASSAKLSGAAGVAAPWSQPRPWSWQWAVPSWKHHRLKAPNTRPEARTKPGEPGARGCLVLWETTPQCTRRQHRAYLDPCLSGIWTCLGPATPFFLWNGNFYPVSVPSLYFGNMSFVLASQVESVCLESHMRLDFGTDNGTSWDFETTRMMLCKYMNRRREERML